jgi:DNA polymerase-3 subunit beta
MTSRCRAALPGVLAVALALSACGGGEGEAAASSTASSAPTSSASAPGPATSSAAGGGAGSTGEGIIGFSGTTNGRASRATTRLLDATFPPYRSLLPTEWASAAEISVPGLVEAVKRVALVTDRNAPVRLEFADGTVSLTAGGDDEGRAEEQLEVGFEGEAITAAFNPQFLLDGLSALSSGTARMQFTSSTKPVVLRPVAGADAAGADAADYTYLIMPVRLPG